nr:HAD-IA family hydrolase [uncultured Cohaesibacter sp.]
MIKALIFDVDGILAETEEAHRRAFNDTFDFFHLDWYWSRETYHKLLRITGGKERMRAYQKAHPNGLRTLQDPEIRAIYKAKTRRYRELLSEGLLSLRAGVEELISHASQRGLRLAIATTAKRPHVEALCRSCWGQAADEIFEVVAACEEMGHKGSVSNLYHLALERLGLAPEECLAFEGSQSGIASAKAVGLAVYASPSLYCREDDLSAADWVSDHLEPDHILAITANPMAEGTKS